MISSTSKLVIELPHAFNPGGKNDASRTFQGFGNAGPIPSIRRQYRALPNDNNFCRYHYPRRNYGRGVYLCDLKRIHACRSLAGSISAAGRPFRVRKLVLETVDLGIQAAPFRSPSLRGSFKLVIDKLFLAPDVSQIGIELYFHFGVDLFPQDRLVHGRDYTKAAVWTWKRSDHIMPELWKPLSKFETLQRVR